MMVKNIKENLIIKKLNEFINSYKFIFLCCFLTVLSNAFSLEFFCWGVAFVSAIIVILFSDDLRAILPIAMLAGFSISRENNKNGSTIESPDRGYFLLNDPKGYITIAVLGGILLILLLIRIFLFKDINKMKKQKYSFKWILLILAISFITAGLFTEHFTLKTVGVGLIKSVCFAVCYFLFLGTIDFKKISFDYFCYLFLSLTIIASLGVAIVYINNFEEVTNVYDGVLTLLKGAVNTGWGGANTIGLLYCMLIPFVFYLASKSKKGYLYIIYIVLSFIVVCFNLSRMTVLFGTIILIIGFIFLIIKGQSKKGNIITLSVILGIGITIFIVFFDKIIAIFTPMLNAGFISLGRIDLIKDAFSMFESSPIFGVAYFANGLGTTLDTYGRYHNIFFESLASTGVVGLIALIIHFYGIFKRVLGKRDPRLCTTLLAVAVLLLFSMFDRFFFVPPIIVFYSLFLTLIDVYAKKEELSGDFLVKKE